MNFCTRKRIFIFIVCTIASIVAGILYSKKNNAKDGFFCTSDSSIHSGVEVLDMAMNFHLENGIGYLSIKGVYSNEKYKKDHVSLLKSFKYVENGGEFLFSQINDGILEVSNEDKEILSIFIPDFYLTNTLPTHHVRIKSIRKGLWLFTTEPVPYFICAEY